MKRFFITLLFLSNSLSADSIRETPGVLLGQASFGHLLMYSETNPISIYEDQIIIAFAETDYSNYLITQYSEDLGDSWSSSSFSFGGYSLRDPSVIATENTPILVWTEGSVGAGESQAYYSFDEFWWNGGIWYPPQAVHNNPSQNNSRVPITTHNMDADGNEYFNVALKDFSITQNHIVTHSSTNGAWETTPLAWSNMTTILDQNQDFAAEEIDNVHSYSSMGINDQGIGYYTVSKYWGDPNTISNHTIFIKRTDNYGESWSDWYFLPDGIMNGYFQGVIADSTYNEDSGQWENLPTDWVPYVAEELETLVDRDGNLNIFGGVIPSSEDSLLTDWNDHTGLYHFRLSNQAFLGGTGSIIPSINYIGSLANLWGQNNFYVDGFKENGFSAAIDKELEDYIYIVYHNLDAGEGNDQYMDLFGAYSPDGGVTWSQVVNITETSERYADESDPHVFNEARNGTIYMSYQTPVWSHPNHNKPFNVHEIYYWDYTFDFQSENDLPIIISEILQNPNTVSDAEGEWFELYNPNSAIIFLQNWSIRDAGSDLFTIVEPLFIPPNNFLVFGINEDSNTNGNVYIDYQFSNFTLGNSNDEIILVNPNGDVIDSVAWDGGPNFPNPNGASMALIDPNIDNSLGTSWTESSTSFGLGDFGTPGLPNFSSNINMDQTILAFDTVFVDQSATLSLTITNDGNSPLSIDLISINSPLFSLSFTDSLVETSAELYITFAPTEYGLVETALYIMSNDPDEGLIEMPLSGIGFYQSPRIELESTSIDFGIIMDGLTSVDSFEVYNRGAEVLVIDSIFCNGNFTVTPPNGTVAPNGRLLLEVQFAPNDVSTFLGEMTIITDNDPDEDTLSVSLAGVGVTQAPEMTLSENEIYFGPVVANQTETRQVTVYNTGALNLEIEDLLISGNHLFSTAFYEATVAPGSSVEIEFQFSPTETLTEVEALATIYAAGVENQTVILRAGYYGPIWHITPTGDNLNGDGSVNNPFASIQSAIDASADGDTVMLAPGVYTEGLVQFYNKSVVLGSNILLANDTSYTSSTVINASDSGFTALIYNADNIEINGLTFVGGSAFQWGTILQIERVGNFELKHCRIQDFLQEDSWVVFARECESVLIQSCEFRNNQEHSSRDGMVYLEVESSQVLNSIFDNNSATTGSALRYEGRSHQIIGSVFKNNSNVYDEGGVIWAQSGAELAIDSCAIFDNSSGVSLNGMSPPASLSITNSTIANNGYGINYLEGYSPSETRPDVLIQNTIFWDQVTDIVSTTYDGDYGYLFEGKIHISNSLIDTSEGWSIYNDGASNIHEDPLFCNFDSDSSYFLSSISPCIDTGMNGESMGVYGIGCVEPVSIDDQTIPTNFTLEQNYPNPFNPSTAFRYAIPVESTVSLVIFDIQGREVKTFQPESKVAGWYLQTWNGLNDSGVPVASGVYLTRLKSGSYSKTIKMLYLK